MGAHGDPEVMYYSAASESLADLSAGPMIAAASVYGMGRRGLSLATCLCSLQPCTQSGHMVVLSPLSSPVGGSVLGH